MRDKWYFRAMAYWRFMTGKRTPTETVDLTYIDEKADVLRAARAERISLYT